MVKLEPAKSVHRNYREKDMTETHPQSVFFKWLQEEVTRTGMTIQQLLEREKKKARDMSPLTENCLNPHEAEEIVLSGACHSDPFTIDDEALRVELHEAAAHTRTCKFCLNLVIIMTPHANS